MLMQIHCIYNWYSFDDEAMIDALYEIASMSALVSFIKSTSVTLLII